MRNELCLMLSRQVGLAEGRAGDFQFGAASAKIVSGFRLSSTQDCVAASRSSHPSSVAYGIRLQFRSLPIRRVTPTPNTLGTH